MNKSDRLVMTFRLYFWNVRQVATRWLILKLKILHFQWESPGPHPFQILPHDQARSVQGPLPVSLSPQQRRFPASQPASQHPGCLLSESLSCHTYATSPPTGCWCAPNMAGVMIWISPYHGTLSKVLSTKFPHRLGVQSQAATNSHLF